MPFHVYILRSESTGQIYIGQTADLHTRLAQHNDPAYRRTLHTKRRRGPWLLLHSEEYPSRTLAMRRERFLKSGQGRQWIHDHLPKDRA